MTARTPEGRICDKILRWLNAQPRTVAHKIHGTAYGSSGEPDIDCVSRGRAIKLEVKTPGTEASIRRRVTKLQRSRLRAYANAGALAAVVVSLDEVQAMIGHGVPWREELGDQATCAVVRARLEDPEPTNQGDNDDG